MIKLLMTMGIILLVVAILGAHIVICARIWRQNSPLKAMAIIAGVSVIAYVVWFLAAIVTGLLIGLMSPDVRGIETDVFYSTFGALIYPCDALAFLENVFNGALCNVPGYLVGIPFFFLLGILSGLITNFLSGSPSD
jgi:hypothetical protein